MQTVVNDPYAEFVQFFEKLAAVEVVASNYSAEKVQQFNEVYGNPPQGNNFIYATLDVMRELSRRDVRSFEIYVRNARLEGLYCLIDPKFMLRRLFMYGLHVATENGKPVFKVKQKRGNNVNNVNNVNKHNNNVNDAAAVATEQPVQTEPAVQTIKKPFVPSTKAKVNSKQGNQAEAKPFNKPTTEQLAAWHQLEKPTNNGGKITSGKAGPKNATHKKATPGKATPGRANSIKSPLPNMTEADFKF
jgi:hypothetical protein